MYLFPLLLHLFLVSLLASPVKGTKMHRKDTSERNVDKVEGIGKKPYIPLLSVAGKIMVSLINTVLVSGSPI